MPSIDQLHIFLSPLIIPAALSAIIFTLIWRKKFSKSLNGKELTFEPLDIWALTICYSISHQSIEGINGFPPNDSFDWLPFGLLALASLFTLGKFLNTPSAHAVNIIAALISIIIIGLSLHGFKIYHEKFSLFYRINVFCALSLTMISSMVSLHAIATKLKLIDFFVFHIALGTIASGTIFVGFNSASIAQLLGITIIISSIGLITGLINKQKKISPGYAIATALIWTHLSCYSYFGNFVLPPTHSLCLLLSAPSLAWIGLLIFKEPNKLLFRRLSILIPSILAALLAFSFSHTKKENADSYEYWEQ
tara:strand:+ start:435 stop:1355 length:921 start_codon:yes stop_codon:yes gene_type:complete